MKRCGFGSKSTQNGYNRRQTLHWTNPAYFQTEKEDKVWDRRLRTQGMLACAGTAQHSEQQRSSPQEAQGILSLKTALDVARATFHFS